MDEGVAVCQGGLIRPAKGIHLRSIEMKPIAIAVLSLAMTSSFAYAHKHKGWGCHAHTVGEEWVKIHCGDGSR